MTKRKIRSQKPILADMHTHLLEKRVNPKKWWAAAKKRELSAVAITEHGEKKPRIAYLKLLKNKPEEIILVPGLEAKTKIGHVLVYGKDESVYWPKELQKKNIPITKVLEIAKKNGFLVSISHPYGYRLDSACGIIGEKKVKKLLKENDIGVEYYNGMLGSANDFIFRAKWARKLYNFLDFAEKNRVFKSLRLAKRSGRTKKSLEKISIETLGRVRKAVMLSQHAKFITVGSDAHYPKNIGSAIVQLKRKPKNAGTFLQMIKRNEIILAGPNFYLAKPVDELKKKELFEGLKYITQGKIGGIGKAKIVRKITKKVSGGKRKIAGRIKKIRKARIGKKLKKRIGGRGWRLRKRILKIRKARFGKKLRKAFIKLRKKRFRRKKK
ncbi:MAG: hypothetical protein NTZ73_03645 [Candidatus Diapherotrites archaeon]|nr:hypothetical protein [Candidatus Diapherotrites archaeon]